MFESGRYFQREDSKVLTEAKRTTFECVNCILKMKSLDRGKLRSKEKRLDRNLVCLILEYAVYAAENALI